MLQIPPPVVAERRVDGFYNDLRQCFPASVWTGAFVFRVAAGTAALPIRSPRPNHFLNAERHKPKGTDK